MKRKDDALDRFLEAWGDIVAQTRGASYQPAIDALCGRVLRAAESAAGADVRTPTTPVTLAELAEQFVDSFVRVHGYVAHAYELRRQAMGIDLRSFLRLRKLRLDEEFNKGKFGKKCVDVWKKRQKCLS